VLQKRGLYFLSADYDDVSEELADLFKAAQAKPKARARISGVSGLARAARPDLRGTIGGKSLGRLHP